MEKEIKSMNKEAQNLRKAFRKSYESIQEEFNDLSKRLFALSLKIDELLGFIEKFSEDLK